MMVNGLYAQLIYYMFVCKLLNCTMVMKYIENKAKLMVSDIPKSTLFHKYLLTYLDRGLRRFGWFPI